MKNRNSITCTTRSLIGCLASLLLAATACAAPALEKSSAARDQKPNVIIILADDIGYGDLGCYGAKLIKTPNMDRLATEGLRCTDAHVAAPVCT